MRPLTRIVRLTQDVLLYGALIVTSALMLLPFFWMVSTSLKPLVEVFGYPPVLISPNSNLDAYIELFTDHNALRCLTNSVCVAATATFLQLFFCSLAGYGFAKFDFPGREALFAVLLGSMIIPFTVVMVPLYKIMRDLGWIDTYWALIVPVVANAFGIFFMRQYIGTINDELLDAARIDGCSEFGIFALVIVPVVRPGLTSLGLILFMRTWNNFLWPLVILKSGENFTMPLLIDSLVGALHDATPEYNLQMAASVISIIPLLIIFLIFQRRFMEGITAGAVR